jgi:hypothetical protein
MLALPQTDPFPAPPASIPRAAVATALGLPRDTDALPPGDLPLDRFAARLIGYLGTDAPGTDTPDAWTGAVMDHLIAEHPALALSVLRAGAPLSGGDRLADPLLELAARPDMDAAIAAAAETDPPFAILVASASEMGDDAR